MRKKTIVALFLCFAMVLTFGGCKNEKSSVDKTSMTIADIDGAITLLAEAEVDCGYENALSELTAKSTNTVNGDNYYRLQQNYQGIPVYGRTVVCITDITGNVTSITGNVLDVNIDIDLSPTITAEQAQQSIQTYITEVLNLQTHEPITIELCEKDLYIYTGTTQPALVYSFLVGANSVIMDAHDASILSWQSIVMPDEIWYTGPEGTKSVQGTHPVEGKYILKDAGRNIYVYDAQGKTYWFPGTRKKPSSKQIDIPKMVNSADTEFGDDNDNTDSSDIAYTFLNELGSVYDFFARMGETGVGTFVGICNDLMNDPNDPTDGYHGLNGGGYCGPLHTMLAKNLPDVELPLSNINAGVIVIGSAYNHNMSEKYDLFGHEYQHTVFQKYVGKSNTHTESGAIDEGIADIMGELYEASRGEINWEHGRRIIHDPSQNGFPESVNEINSKLLDKLDTDFAHGCSTVISHSAYLMWNGIDGNSSQRLSSQELAELWYRTVLMMPSDCDFILCRQLVEVAAQSMETLSNEQRKCVRKAFDCVGIPSSREEHFYPDYRLNKDATLTVYDQNNEPYSGYTLHINSMSEIGSNMTSDIGWVVNRTNTIDTPGAYALDLPQGRYALTITDHHYDESYTIYVEINNDYTETNIDLITAYEEPLVVVIKPNTQKQLSSIVTYQDGEKAEEYHFIYNDFGQVASLVAYRYEGGNTKRWYTQTYKYDGNGNPILTEHISPRGSIQTYQYKYDYNSEGRIACYNSLECYDDTPGLSETYIFSYDDQGRIVEKRNEYGTSVEKFFYDETGNTVHKLEDIYEDDGHFINKTTYNSTYAPLVITTHTSESKEYGNSSSKSIAFMPHWNLTIASWSIDDTCSFIFDAFGCLTEVIDIAGEKVCVCKYEDLNDDEEHNDNSPSIISEEKAYQIACDYWDYSVGDVSSETGFELYVVPEYGEALKQDTKTGKYYYCYLLRWLVVTKNGDSWMSTCDIVHIDAETGECTYFS